MSTAAEIAAGAAVEVVFAAAAIGILYRIWGKFFAVPRRLVVPPFQTGVVLRDGQAEKTVPAGSYWLMPKRTILTCDTRPTPFQLPAHECLTGDNMGLRIALTGQYRIVDPIAFVTSSSNATGAFLLEVNQSLRTAVAELSGHNYIVGRATLPARIQQLVTPRAARFGIELSLVEIAEYVPLGWLKAAMPQPTPDAGHPYGPN